LHLNIKSDEAHRLATELARLTGESLTTTVTLALRERLDRAQRRAQRQGVAEALLDLGRRYAALPERDPRTADEILGYDENGLPT
jgi:antitoxin VapB